MENVPFTLNFIRKRSLENNNNYRLFRRGWVWLEVYFKRTNFLHCRNSLTRIQHQSEINHLKDTLCYWSARFKNRIQWSIHEPVRRVVIGTGLFVYRNRPLFWRTSHGTETEVELFLWFDETASDLHVAFYVLKFLSRDILTVDFGLVIFDQINVIIRFYRIIRFHCMRTRRFRQLSNPVNLILFSHTARNIHIRVREKGNSLEKYFLHWSYWNSEWSNAQFRLRWLETTEQSRKTDKLIV